MPYKPNFTLARESCPIGASAEKEIFRIGLTGESSLSDSNQYAPRTPRQSPRESAVAQVPPDRFWIGMT